MFAILATFFFEGIYKAEEQAINKLVHIAATTTVFIL